MADETPEPQTVAEQDAEQRAAEQPEPEDARLRKTHPSGLHGVLLGEDGEPVTDDAGRLTILPVQT